MSVKRRPRCELRRAETAAVGVLAAEVLMGWATEYIAGLRRGETVQFRPRGHSMRGKIDSGQLVTVEPAPEKLEVGDIVLCKAGGRQYLHVIKAIQGERYQIGNARGHINGWVSRGCIYGKCVQV